MSARQISFADKLLTNFDKAVRTLAPGKVTHFRPSPSRNMDDVNMSEVERKHAAGLMRVNHSGEVCAQALYQGQALTAKLPHIRSEMEQAAAEEIDHLAWCQERLDALDSQPSMLNPLWYGLSFGVGAVAGLIGDKVSLGFVAATEDQVCKHLENHLQDLPEQDAKSRAVVVKMLEDEARHASAALDAGGVNFPAPIKGAMTVVSKVMTKASYKI